MNDESSTFYVEIAGPIADIHKLSSCFVLCFFFQLSTQYSQCTIGPLEVCLICLLPFEKILDTGS